MMDAAGGDGGEDMRRRTADALAVIVYAAAPGEVPRLESANRYALEYFGYAAAAVEGVGWLELIHPDDRGDVLATWAEALAAGRGYRHTHRVRMADGRYRLFRAEALPLRDEAGVPVKWCGVLTPLEGPRIRGPEGRPGKVDYYPLRDTLGNLVLAEVTRWESRPDDPAARRHQDGAWYRVDCLDG
jgi:PAS domain S-box-containing protein